MARDKSHEKYKTNHGSVLRLSLRFLDLLESQREVFVLFFSHFNDKVVASVGCALRAMPLLNRIVRGSGSTNQFPSSVCNVIYNHFRNAYALWSMWCSVRGRQLKNTTISTKKKKCCCKVLGVTHLGPTT